MKILYVEDNPANLFLIKRVAKMGDHEVVNLIDGEEALRKIDMIKPDLILMDIQLAGALTGLDVVRKLRSSGYTMPIVAVTAYAMVGDRERCLEAGCNEYLSKPLPIGRVVELLQLYQAGVPAPAPQDEDDSATNIPILTRVPNQAEDAPVTPTAPAETPAAPAAPAKNADINALVTSEVKAVTSDAPASDTPEAKAESVPVPPAPAADAPATPEASAQTDAATVTPVSETQAAAPSNPVPPVTPESVPEAQPTAAPTSQDTSHSQDTVQAQ